jgi:hypothetical protein
MLGVAAGPALRRRLLRLSVAGPDSGGAALPRACKPISEEDLATFIADCIFDEDKPVRGQFGHGRSLILISIGPMGNE